MSRENNPMHYLVCDAFRHGVQLPEAIYCGGWPSSFRIDHATAGVLTEIVKSCLNGEHSTNDRGTGRRVQRIAVRLPQEHDVVRIDVRADTMDGAFRFLIDRLPPDTYIAVRSMNEGRAAPAQKRALQ